MSPQQETGKFDAIDTRSGVAIDRTGVAMQQRLLRLRKLGGALRVGVTHKSPYRFDSANPARVFLGVHVRPLDTTRLLFRELALQVAEC